MHERHGSRDATASDERATRVRRCAPARSRRAPLPRARLAVRGGIQGRMQSVSRHDEEVERLRDSVHCAALLERLPPPWRLDRAESTRECLKYRRGTGEIIIVNHGGRGWWDPGSTAKGDAFALVQHLSPDLNFGHVRKVLRGVAGLPPSFPPHVGARAGDGGAIPPLRRWAKALPIRFGSRVWHYLAEVRCLPGRVLRAARACDAVREGAYGTAWFAHRSHLGELTGFDMRGPDFRGFAKGAEKALFRLPGAARLPGPPPHRFVVAEAPIDALSLAAIERLRDDTLYLATSGGMGARTLDALQRLLAATAGAAEATLLAATDNDAAGARYAAVLKDQARDAGVAYQRFLPRDGFKDWNDVLTRGGGA